MSNNSKDGNSSVLGYLILIAVGLFVAWYILKVIYYILSYLALNLFLTLDLSAFGKVSEEQWIGYALLGLGLGAAGGAIAAQQRFRLNKLISAGAVLLVLTLFGFVFKSAPASASLPQPSPEVETTEDPDLESEISEPYKKTQATKIEEKPEPEVVIEDEHLETFREEQVQEIDSSAYPEQSVDPEPTVPESNVVSAEKVVNINSLLNFMESYYGSLNSDQFNADNFFVPEVRRFIKEKKVTPSEINSLQKDYRAEFTNGVSRIQKDTFIPLPMKNSLRYFQYWVDFECFRQSKQKKQTCKVLVEIGIDGSGKIASYEETKVKYLQFY